MYGFFSKGEETKFNKGNKNRISEKGTVKIRDEKRLQDPTVLSFHRWLKRRTLIMSNIQIPL